MPHENAFVYEKTIHAPADLIYRAFTSGTAFREWLCDLSTTDPEEGGWIYLIWNRGYFASGYFTELIPDKLVHFKWIGMGEPAWTQVEVVIKPIGDERFNVVLKHSGIGQGDEWIKAREEISKGWLVGLDNLKSTLEEGQDLRVVKRPLIGIYPVDLSELTQTAKEALNVPVEQGVQVRDLVSGYGADQAGIQPDDVIVAVDGQEIDGVRGLLTRMAEFSSGDTLEVTAYRGNQLKTFEIHAKPQKVEVLPETPEELAKEVENRISEALETLEGVLEGVSDIEASYSPGPEEWSSKENLVHLILSEREMHTWLNDLVAGHERIQDEWPGNLLFRIRATLTAYPTVDDLLAEYKRSLKETVAIVAFLDQNFTRRKTSYWRMGMELLSVHEHIRDHIHQIEDNIHEARTVMSKES